MKDDAVGRLLGWLFWPAIAAACAFALAPVYLLFKISISPPAEVLTQHPTFLVHAPTARHWLAVLAGPDLFVPLVRSLAVATGTTLLALAIAAPAAYVIARLPRAVRQTTVLALLVARMFPDVLIALPVAVAFIRLGLLDTIPGLVLAHTIGNLPFLAWILVGTFEAIPPALEEAAFVDGCTRLTALLYVILPAARPGLLVGGLFVWLASWNEFTYAMYLSTATKTLPLQTYFYQARGSAFDAAAYATLLTLPVIVLTFAVQRHLVAGALTGAVRG